MFLAVELPASARHPRGAVVRVPAVGTAEDSERAAARRAEMLKTAGVRKREGERRRKLREWMADVSSGGAFGLYATDDEIRARAREITADLCDVAQGIPEVGMSKDELLRRLRPVLEGAAVARNIAPPKAKTDEGACARLLSSDWWARRLRTAHGRRLEYFAVWHGLVHKKAARYVSDDNLRRRTEQRERNARVLAHTEIENENGDVWTLAELAERSNANPTVRRAELMARMKGFTVIAQGVGHVADFWTLTCPSRFHQVRRTGEPNPKRDGSTAREAQAHLRGCFARLRAALARRKIALYGLRIAEPHHDGCPHWHLVLFGTADSLQAARALASYYFLEQHEPEEQGARAQRCKYKRIDPQQGDAVAYVAKYVAKNVDGFRLGEDVFGQLEIQTAARVDAWAATHGIRQFQQIGGAPVGAWRELRRLKEAQQNPTLEAARAAADAGDWAGYVIAQGGPAVGRKAAVRVAYSREGERYDVTAGECLPAENRYGEKADGAAFGVRCGRDLVATRVHAWSEPDAERKGRGIAAWAARVTVRGLEREAKEGKRGPGLALQQARRAAAVADRARRGVRGGKRAARAAWTRVNNCTQGGEGGNDGSATNGGFGERASRNQGAGGHQSGAFVGQIDGGEGIATARGGARGHLAGAARAHVRGRAPQRGGLTDGE